MAAVRNPAIPSFFATPRRFNYKTKREDESDRATTRRLREDEKGGSGDGKLEGPAGERGMVTTKEMVRRKQFSLIKWSTPSNEECGEKLLMQPQYKLIEGVFDDFTVFFIVFDHANECTSKHLLFKIHNNYDCYKNE